MVNNNQKIIVFITSLIVGIMIFSQHKTYKNIGLNEIREPESNLFRVINVYLKTNKELKSEAEKLENEISDYENEYSRLQLFEKNLEHNELLAGDVKAQGSGIKFTLTKSVNTLGLVDLTNELWNVGAEVVAVNGLRITENQSGFADIGEMVTLNGIPLNAPLIIESIGDSAAIVKALEQSGGIISRLQKKDSQLKVNLEEVERILIEKVEN